MPAFRMLWAHEFRQTYSPILNTSIPIYSMHVGSPVNFVHEEALFQSIIDRQTLPQTAAYRSSGVQHHLRCYFTAHRIFLLHPLGSRYGCTILSFPTPSSPLFSFPITAVRPIGPPPSLTSSSQVGFQHIHSIPPTSLDPKSSAHQHAAEQ